MSICSFALAFYFERGEKGFLRYFHPANLFHAPLASLLLLEELLLAGYVATVALGCHVFT